MTLAQREELIERESELDSVGAFLDGLHAEPGALALERETGVGKTASWLPALVPITRDPVSRCDKPA